jgi:hypothetical protein
VIRWAISSRASLFSRAAFAAALSLIASTAAGAQSLPQPAVETSGEGMFPDASFDLTFRKYTPPDNPFSPFYAWDGHLDLQATVFRVAVSSVAVRSVIQAIGTENFGQRVGVAATGYLLGLRYVHAFSLDTTLSAGISHVSSHLTRDLDQKLDEQRSGGIPIPVVRDPGQYNVLFFKAHRRFPALRFEPEIEVAIEPLNFRFSGRRVRYVRPVFVGTRSTLWQRNQTSVVAETQHEIGRNPFNRISVSLELFARNQPEGRLQIFASASPGRNFHVSTNVGGVRDGIAFGVRLKFRT